MSSVIKPFIELCRISNLPTVWTNVTASIVLSGAGFSWSAFLLLAGSMSLFYSGGMCLNDICDASVDKTGKPFRPIPSDRISINKASLFTILLFLTGFVMLLFIPYTRAVYAGLILLIFIVVYDKYHKSHSFSVILMASCRLMIFIVSCIAVTGKVGMLAAGAGFVQFVYTLIISMVARHENTRRKEYSLPVVPGMIACISLIDGIVMAFFVSPVWLAAGIGGAVLTTTGQKFIRGD